jgi:hypothetical protein
VGGPGMSFRRAMKLCKGTVVERSRGRMIRVLTVGDREGLLFVRLNAHPRLENIPVHPLLLVFHCVLAAVDGIL